MAREVKFQGKKSLSERENTFRKKRRQSRITRVTKSGSRGITRALESGQGRGRMGRGLRPVIRTKKKRGRGRPHASYTSNHPITGQSISAKQHTQVLKEMKRRARAQAELKDIQAIQALARRGIPPEQARVIADAQQLRRVLPQNLPLREEQAELQRAQHIAPFARQEVIRQLMRKRQVVQIHQQAQQPHVFQEVSLLDGRVRTKVNPLRRKEKWTYS